MSLPKLPPRPRTVVTGRQFELCSRLYLREYEFAKEKPAQPEAMTLRRANGMFVYAAELWENVGKIGLQPPNMKKDYESRKEFIGYAIIEALILEHRRKQHELYKVPYKDNSSKKRKHEEAKNNLKEKKKAEKAQRAEQNAKVREFMKKRRINDFYKASKQMEKEDEDRLAAKLNMEEQTHDSWRR